MIMLCLLGAQLGNQLFAYAFGRFLADRHATDLWVNPWRHDPANVKTRVPHRFRLPEFQVQYSYCSLDWTDERAVRAAFPHLTYFHQTDDIASADQFGAADNLILVGEWASYTSYLVDEDGPMLPLLRREFNLKSNHRSAEYARLRERIELCDRPTVAVHVRLGDNRASDTGFPLLGDDYYARAFSCIEQSAASPAYFVFSDEIDYVEANYRFPPGASVELVRTGSDLEDFDLMKRCSHNIIANSTYSWWAACLNENQSKKVVAPLKYYSRPDWQEAYETATGEWAYMPPAWTKV